VIYSICAIFIFRSELASGPRQSRKRKQKTIVFWGLDCWSFVFLNIIGIWHEGKFKVREAFACCGQVGNPAFWIGSDCSVPTDPNGTPIPNGDRAPIETCTISPTHTRSPTPTQVPQCQNTDCSQQVDGLEPCLPCTAGPTASPQPTPPPDTPTAVPTDTPPPTPTPCPTIDAKACKQCDDDLNSESDFYLSALVTCNTGVPYLCESFCAAVVSEIFPICTAGCIDITLAACGAACAAGQANALVDYQSCVQANHCFDSGC
jgi:hypothetical protein